MRNSGKPFSFPHSFLAVSSLTSYCFFRQGRWPSPFSSLTAAVTAFFRLTPRGKHPGKTNSKFYSTPLRTEVTTIHFSCHRVEAQPVTPSSLGPSGFAGSGGWGQRGWCSHPCRRRLGTCFCRNYRKRWCPHTWPCSACLTSATQEVALLFWPSFHHPDSFPTPGQCAVPLPRCEWISFLSITNIGLIIAYLRKKKVNCRPPNSVVSHCG